MSLEAITTAIKEVGKNISKTAVKEIGKNISETAVKEIQKSKVESIKSSGDGVLMKLNDIKNLTPEKLNEQAKENIAQKYERFLKGCLPRTDGEWDGEIGNSRWRPDPDYIPKKMNPKNETWGTILDKYNIDSIEFKDGYPDFSEIAKEEVQIDDFTEDRSINFDQADEKLAKEWECSPEDVEKWRKENKYTWHECEDCKTMQLVPSEVHGNISHSGGISEYKKL